MLKRKMRESRKWSNNRTAGFRRRLLCSGSRRRKTAVALRFAMKLNSRRNRFQFVGSHTDISDAPRFDHA
jgi:hypothetical protein